MTTPRVKICCISSIDEARTAIKHGASALGLVGQMPSGPGVISDLQIRTIAASVPPPISTFLLTSETNPKQIINHHKRVLTATIQIVDELEEREYDVIRENLPGIKLVQVIHVMNESSIKEAVEISGFVDAILVDSGNPIASVKQLGGTGWTHNWEISKKIREAISIPLFLAGGLTKDIVAEAIDAVQPFGVDVCSGVRTDGMLDEKKLKVFFEALP